MRSLEVQGDVVSQIVSQDAFVQKLHEEFTTGEQRWFVDNFTVYLGHDATAFVVDLDDALTWLGFSSRDAALRVVKSNLEAGVDFKITPQVGEVMSQGGGPGKEVHMLTVDAFKMLCVLAGTTEGDVVRRYYIRMESVLMKHLTELHSVRELATPDEVALLEAIRGARRRLIAGGVESYASAQRLTVRMVADELVRSGRITQAAARDNAHLVRAGASIAEVFKGRKNSGEITMLSDGAYELTWSGEDPVRIQHMTSEIMCLCRMRHAVAYGLQEVHAHTMSNPWTYPAAFKVDMERVMCAEFGIPVVMRSAFARTSPWG